MKLDITPCMNASYNCLDVLILTLAKHWQLEHRMMFADSWRFKYSKVSPDAASVSFEEVLNVSELVEQRNIEDALHKYHGLIVRRNEMPDLQRAKGLIKQELAEGFPVAIGVDAFHCHWSAAFRKYHLEHFCLAVGIDDEEQNLFVIDPHLTPAPLLLLLADYAETLRDSLSFRYRRGVQELPDWRGLVYAAAMRLLGESASDNRFQQMRELAADLEKHLDFQREVVQHADPFGSFLVLYFKTLSFSRLNFAEYLGYLAASAQVKGVAEVATRMKEQGNNLYKIFLLLMKMSLTPERFNPAMIARRLLDVADHEEALALKLVAISHS